MGPLRPTPESQVRHAVSLAYKEQLEVPGARQASGQRVNASARQASGLQVGVTKEKLTCDSVLY